MYSLSYSYAVVTPETLHCVVCVVLAAWKTTFIEIVNGIYTESSQSVLPLITEAVKNFLHSCENSNLWSKKHNEYLIYIVSTLCLLYRELYLPTCRTRWCFERWVDSDLNTFRWPFVQEINRHVCDWLHCSTLQKQI